MLACLLWGLLAGSGWAQEVADARLMAIWDATATRAEAQIADPSTSTPELEALRDRLAKQRGDALAAEQAQKPVVDDLNRRLQALGPAPAEGTDEAPEIAERRKALQAQIAIAQVPIVEAQEANQRADALIQRIDRIVRGRFSAELLSRGASPLLPATWMAAFDEIGRQIAVFGTGLATAFEDPVGHRLALRRLPLKIALVVAGLVVTFTLRRWLTDWVEGYLAARPNRRAVAWALALRNLIRLLVPAAGIGLLLAAFDPEGLFSRSADGRYFFLPAFAMVLIVAVWLRASLLAPRHQPFRLVPLDDREARLGARLALALGVIAAVALFLSGVGQRWDLTTTAQSAILFPLVLLGAVGLWRVARLIDLARGRLIAAAARDRSGSPTTSIGLRALRLMVRALQIIALTAPVMAAAGYLPLAGFLVFRSALTLGLFGAGLVVFDLLNRAALLLFYAPSPQGSDDDGGLTPVAVAALVGLACLAPLAMIWGARPSDIAEVWAHLREGVEFGGMRISAGVISTFVAVFALGVGLTRLFQAVLRGSVLPRTRLDAGGRNAVLAGVSYLGFTLAGLAAVAAAGINLSSIAIVAGALSVGIGFGLQNVVSNFVSGIILLVERPVKEGDWIEVGGFAGYVKGINVRSTEIQTFDRSSVILPNSDLVAGTVLNRTHTGMSGRLQVPVGVGYDSDPRKVEAVLLSIAEGHPLVLEDPSPVVLFMGFGASSLDFEIRCWLRDVNFSLSTRSDMNFEIMARFSAEGIEIPFPQRDVNLKGVEAIAAAFGLGGSGAGAPGPQEPVPPDEAASGGDAKQT